MCSTKSLNIHTWQPIHAGYIIRSFKQTFDSVTGRESILILDAKLSGAGAVCFVLTDTDTSKHCRYPTGATYDDACVI